MRRKVSFFLLCSCIMGVTGSSFSSMIHLNKFDRCMCGPIIILCMYVKCQYIFYMEKQLQTNRFKAPVLQAYPSKVGQVTHVPKQLRWRCRCCLGCCKLEIGAHFLRSDHLGVVSLALRQIVGVSSPPLFKIKTSFWHLCGGLFHTALASMRNTPQKF